VLADKKMNQIDRLFLSRARAPAKQQKLLAFEEFAFDKKLVIGGMALIYKLLGQDDLRIAGEGKHTRLPAVVSNADSPDLHIIFRRDGHNGAQNDVSILPLEFDAVRVEVHFASIGRRLHWLPHGRP
jgi:hypothetical protein